MSPSNECRRVVITGGGTGIGLAIAHRFAAAGDRLTILGRRAAVLDEAASLLGSVTERPVETIPTDIEDAGQVARAARTIAAGGLVDVLVNNAGGLVPQRSDLPEDVAENWLATYRNNVVTAVLCTDALRSTLRRPGVRVIAVSSLAATSGAGAYGAAKAALHAWVYSLAQELGPQGITVNAVAPGFVPDTGFWDGRRDEQIAAPRIARTLVGRAGTPDEVAEAVWYLASPAAGFTTAQILRVDGGAPSHGHG